METIHKNLKIKEIRQHQTKKKLNQKPKHTQKHKISLKVNPPT